MAKRRGRLINLGFDNAVMADRIIAVTASESKPMRRLIDLARQENKVVDATSGRKTRSVIVTDSGHIILSASEPKTIAQRIDGSQAS